MSSNTPSRLRRNNKIALASLTIVAALAANRTDVLTKVYAATNTLDWTKQEDLDRLGGYYSSAAVSADGNSLILGVSEGGENSANTSPLYISSDYGATWENVADEIDPEIRHWWNSVDISDDGQVMVASSDWGFETDGGGGVDGKVFLSEDGGDTWSNITPADEDDWRQVTVSGDGSTVAAIRYDIGAVRVTQDGGDTWADRVVTEGGNNAWNLKSISISDDGEKMLVGGENQVSPYTKLYLSENTGNDWSDITPNPEDELHTISHDISATGGKIVVSTNGWTGEDNDAVFVTENDGADWTEISPDENANAWVKTAISDDGSTISVVNQNETMFLSGDSGANWNEEAPGQDYEDINEWTSVDINEDGTKLIVAGEDNAYLSGFVANEATVFTNAEDAKTVTLTLPSGTTLTCHSAVKESGLTGADGIYSYPHGLVDFCFSGADTNNEITLLFVTDLKPNQVAVRKYNPADKKYTTITEATVTETTYNSQPALRVTYTIVDNGPLDTDPDTGEVADPVGLGVLDVTAPNTGLAPLNQKFTDTPASLPIWDLKNKP